MSQGPRAASRCASNRVAGARVHHNITTQPTAHSVSQPVIPSYGTLGAVKWKPSSRVQRAAKELTNLSGIFLALLSLSFVCHFCHGTLFLRYVVKRLSHETLLPKCPCFHIRLSRLVPIPSYPWHPSPPWRSTIDNTNSASWHFDSLPFPVPPPPSFTYK
ncbi:hypothetical protein BDP81DRAFT_165836 [Colletotrichum phormii]|uniref:Uncharacterized protein n=1 Tax=Colletotrichum phormii TaxID=359342 RepID=A0AAI9ZZ91_9PEZI|nr:uncharacterized protein BDP81DRAFT_165836 [Colletotrichum phormii]KAK1640596.1 hypothetical protein BDP81DRAFT_165836 [Colletotrichum phormii]